MKKKSHKFPIRRESFKSPVKKEKKEKHCKKKKIMSTTISKLAPVQKGTVRWKDNECVFEGKWAMSEEQYQKGDTSAFYYAAKGAVPASREPFTGKYDGYFYMTTFAPEPIKVIENNVTLRFLVGAENQGDKIRVVGFGRNGYGEFELNGEYDSSDGSVVLNKVYKGLTSYEEDIE